jgi:hypothetical protein
MGIGNLTYPHEQNSLHIPHTCCLLLRMSAHLAGEMKAVAAGALGIGCVIFLVLALGSIAAFGPALNSNILNNMSATGMAPLIGSGPAAVSTLQWEGGGAGWRCR